MQSLSDAMLLGELGTYFVTPEFALTPKCFLSLTLLSHGSL
jgi:hypothetical protein